MVVVIVTKVECSSGPDALKFCDEHAIDGFPTVVECSSGPDALKFCDEHAIDGFPTVVLTG
ncbi:hypothetical protein T484DRAFT_1800483, partial [Baffinella frigidus]